MKKNLDHYDVVIVGAGISGAVLAERYSTILGKKVLILESRPHVGGNCYDYINEEGILIAKYGPHFFHTNDKGVWDYIHMFSEWIPYEHRVIAHVDGKKVPVPVNITTVNTLFNLNIKSPDEMQQWLESNTEKIAEPKNSEESALKRVGKNLYEKLFKSYTIKQWDKYPYELGSEVLDRIPVRIDFDDRYFTDLYQGMPKRGYTALFEKMLSHKNIEIKLATSWEALQNSISYDTLFFTGKIDSYFQEKYGKLQYRSLRFEFETLNQESFQERTVENYPSSEVPFTRITEFKKATGQQHQKTTICREYPTWDGEPYYPVPSTENKLLYAQYQA
ncbi:UDP-galactopyranose mutase, partial [Patescibacteria group bacterium]|nr:UDP-galactopyranose mutase [Patescibacteria group bacterium]